jgi:Amt family ammonium transporter
VWGGGWLASLGAFDFAGGTVVHVNAAAAALVAALVLGKRSDYGSASILPHNVPFVLLGAGVLWFGWFGFNAGSALAASPQAGLAFVTTMLAPAATLVVWTILDAVRTGKPTSVGCATAIVVGLVAITPAAGYVTPLAAIAIGTLGASASYSAMQIRVRTRIDDALDVFACHGVAGIVGALLTGLFATTAVNPAGADGLLAGNARLLGVQALAVLTALAFTGGLTALILFTLKSFGSLRVPAWDELAGVDQSEHGEHAYHGDDGTGIAGGGIGLSGGILVPMMPEEAKEKNAA